MIIFLGGEPPGGERFKLLGPTHHARWMGKVIYCIKMCLFLKQARLEQQVSQGILELTLFAIKVYAKAWFSAPNPVAAPRNDLNFVKCLVDYEQVNVRMGFLTIFHELHFYKYQLK